MSDITYVDSTEGAGPSSNTDRGTHCPICYLEIEGGEVSITHTLNNCLNTFHRECLDSWVNTSSATSNTSNCPLCRQPIALTTELSDDDEESQDEGEDGPHEVESPTLQEPLYREPIQIMAWEEFDTHMLLRQLTQEEVFPSTIVVFRSHDEVVDGGLPDRDLREVLDEWTRQWRPLAETSYTVPPESASVDGQSVFEPCWMTIHMDVRLALPILYLWIPRGREVYNLRRDLVRSGWNPITGKWQAGGSLGTSIDYDLTFLLARFRN